MLEKRDKPGGRAYVYEQDGFRFDGGPTIITAPNFIHDLFAVAGRKTEDYVRLVKLDPFYNIRFEDGSVFHYNDDEKDLIEQIRAFNPADVKGYERFYQASQAVFEKGLPLMTQPFLSPLDMLKVAPDMVQLQSFNTVAGFVNQYIQDPRLRQVFSFHPLLIGGNPFQCTLHLRHDPQAGANLWGVVRHGRYGSAGAGVGEPLSGIGRRITAQCRSAGNPGQ